jgi:O-antigen/teichoic acid export membrane protein
MLVFVFQYLGAVSILFYILNKEGNFWLHFKRSRVTDKFKKKIVAIMSLTFLVIIVTVLRQSIDTMVLASKINLEAVGVFGFAAYLVSILQAPFRSMVAITIPILSSAWKDKKIKDITKIYKRSSINLLTFSLFMFGCIWLNFDAGIELFKINPEYLAGKWVFFVLGIVTIIEMGTGVNGQIIGTSTYWRFELWTSLLLTALIIPLSYFLTVQYGILGPALANLISFSVYNGVRIWFLWNKFNMQPFNLKSLEIIFIAIAAYLLIYLTIGNKGELIYMILSTSLFAVIFISLLYFRNISPDVKPVVQALLKRISRDKK